MGDLVYKGFVGTALDAVPMDAEERLALQRTSAVVSGTLTGRSLSVWAGFTHPLLLIAGAVWGFFSASNIKAAQTSTDPALPRIDRDSVVIEDRHARILLVIGPAREEDR